MRLFTLLLLCTAFMHSTFGQAFEDKAEFKVNVSDIERFHLYNHRGAVTVRAVNGNTATLKVTRSLKTGFRANLEKAKKEIYMDKMEKDGHVIFYIAHPQRELIFEDGEAHYNSKNTNNWDWNSKNQVKSNFTVVLEIPANTDLSVRNHEHPLKISGMQGDLKAANHHDGVLVEGQGGSADVHSHHGDVEVYYTKNPTRDCSYDTHHGDIKIHYQDGLSVDASMYSYHGEFFTDFDWTMSPVSFSTDTSQGKKGTKYKVSSKNGTSVKINDGGPLQKFRTHHGDVYLLNQ